MQVKLRFNGRLGPVIVTIKRSQLPRDVRRECTVARLMGLRVKIPPGGLTVSYGCCVMSGRGLRDGLITRPEESYRL